MTNKKWNVMLALAVIYTVAMLLIIEQMFIGNATGLLDDNDPEIVLWALVILSILVFKLFEETLRSMVMMTLRVKAKDKDGKNSTEHEPDVFLSWMRIIFSKED